MMIKGLVIILSIGLIIFNGTTLNAQPGSHQHFLQKIGALDSLYSNTLQETRTFYVQLPTYYIEGERYPVAYILDGEVFLPTVANVESFYGGGFIPEMILVGISNANNRTRDLTPTEVTQMHGMPFDYENGKAANFSQFIEKELIPYIENKYPVTNYRTLIGHSYGGLFTLHTLIHQPELFDNYLAIDPSLDWDNQRLLKEAQEKLPHQDYHNKSLFVSLSGQLHMQNSKITLDNVMQDTSSYTLFARSNISFSNVARANANNGLNFDWKFYPRDIHGTIPLPSIMDGLIAMFEWYQMESIDKINSFDTPKEVLYMILKNREAKLKSHFGYSVPPYPEELINMSGYMNMEMGQKEKAKMYFELAIEYYPESANAYDAMADYFEAQNDITNAVKFVQKAAELSDKEYYKKRLQTLKDK